MLNLLYDIERSAFRAQSLRTKIAELTGELHAEETKIAVLARQCIGVMELDLQEENAKATIARISKP